MSETRKLVCDIQVFHEVVAMKIIEQTHFRKGFAVDPAGNTTNVFMHKDIDLEIRSASVPQLHKRDCFYVGGGIMEESPNNQNKRNAVLICNSHAEAVALAAKMKQIIAAYNRRNGVIY